MISPTANFNAKNASLVKDAVITLEIDGYPRLLSTKKVTGIYNATDYPLPFPTPAGQYVAWALPTVTDNGSEVGGATGGSATSDLTSGLLTAQHLSGFFNMYWYARWYGFTMPALPVGAVIQGIYAVAEASEWDPSNAFYNLFTLGGNNTLVAPGGGVSSVSFNGPPAGTSEPLTDSTYYRTVSIGNTTADVTNASIIAQFDSELSKTGNATLRINNPRLAIYFTYPGGPQIGDPWIESIDGLGFEADILNGTSSMDDVTVSVIDYQRNLTADMALYVLEGKTCRLKTGFVGLDYSDYVTLFTGIVKTIPSAENDLVYQFVLNNTMLEMKKIIYQTGDDGQPTDSDHPKTVIGNPIDIVKSILLDYLAMSPGSVDIAKLDAYRDEYFAGAQMQFKITSPPEAKAFIEEQIMKPLGGYLWPTNRGVIRPNFLVPLAGAAGSVKSLTNADMLTIPEANQADLVNTIAYRFDKVDDKFTSEVIVTDQTSISKYGEFPGQAIESDGMRSSLQAFFLAKLAGQSIFNRFGDKNPTFAMECFWDCMTLQLGDEVDVTHALMPDRRAGTMGVTAALFEVAGVTYDLQAMTVTLTLIDAAFASKLGRWKVAPDATADWTAASSSDKDTYMFISDSTGQMSDSSDGHTLA